MSETVEVSPANDVQRRVEIAYERNRGLLQHLARRRFHVPVEDVEPLVHDAFVSYLRHHARVQDERAWLVGAIYNLCREYWSSRGQPSPETLGVPSKLLLDEIAARVDAGLVLSQLSERCREVLRRRFLEGYSTNDLAAWLTTTTANAKVMVHRCKARAFALFTRPHQSA